MSDQPETLQRSVRFLPAWDKRDADPKKNYGIHEVEIFFALTGSRGAISFVIYTGWHLPHVQRELDSKADSGFPHLHCHPQPADVSYHSYVPVYEEQTPASNCSLLGGKPCYYDGSGLAAKDVFDVLVRDGDEAMWKELERWYETKLARLEPKGDAI